MCLAAYQQGQQQHPHQDPKEMKASMKTFPTQAPPKEWFRSLCYIRISPALFVCGRSIDTVLRGDRGPFPSQAETKKNGCMYVCAR